MTRQELRDLQHALEMVFSGDMRLEAGCLADQLDTLGYVGLTPAPPTRVTQEPLPLAATTGLGKRRSA